MVTADDLLVVDGLSIDYSAKPPVRAVDGVSFRLGKSERVGLVGESGCGKSTIASALLGLVEPPGRVIAGRILFEGVSLLECSVAELNRIRGSRIGIVFQDALTSLNPVMTIGRQITETIRHHLHVSEQECQDRAKSLLEEVGITDPRLRLDQYPHELSGGMRQRAFIAMALAVEPQLVIADEATSSVDVTTQVQVLEVLLKVASSRKTAVLLITHDMGVVRRFAERVLVMYAGRLVEDSSVRRVFTDASHPYSRALIGSIPRIWGQPRGRLVTIPGTLQPPGVGSSGCRFEPRCPIGNGRRQCIEEAPPLRHLTGDAWVACHFADEREMRPQTPDLDDLPLVAVGRSTAVLQVRHLTKDFEIRRGFITRTLRALSDVSFEIARGEAVGLVGESGSGKSTVARIIVGLEKATSGEVLYGGRRLRLLTNPRDRGGRIQMVFQDPTDSLDPYLTIEACVAEPLRIATRFGHSAALSNRITELLEMVGLSPKVRGRYPRELSGGERQRVAIARALATSPDVIVFDEAVSSLDVSVRAQILLLLNDIRERLNLSYLFISHDLAVVRHVCDHVLVLYRGHLVEASPAEDLFAHPVHPYTVSLLSAVADSRNAGPSGRLKSRRDSHQRGARASLCMLPPDSVPPDSLGLTE